MESMVHIGNKIDKKSYEDLAAFIEKVMASGEKHRMSDDVVVKSLDLAREVFSISGVELRNNCFWGARKRQNEFNSRRA